MPPEVADFTTDDVARTRAAIIGTRKTPTEIARALGCCERSVVNIINEQHVPYIKFLGKRFVEPEKVAEALQNRERNRPARGVGRPQSRRAA